LAPLIIAIGEKATSPTLESTRTTSMRGARMNFVYRNPLPFQISPLRRRAQGLLAVIPLYV
jgi:hypothetical protein